MQTLEKAKAKAKAKLDDAKLAADQEWEALKHASSTPAHKVSGMTPEERETGAAGAVSVLSLVSAVGDRKTALVAGVAANVLASSSLPSQASARDLPHATSAAAGSSSSADSSSLPDRVRWHEVGVVSDGGTSEIVVIRVVATAPAVGLMRVHVEGVGDF